ncbi:MAG: HAD family hydrolase, partial [Clostridia bacterium]|nr:HAD family hydrolase [Clostridia bacterium]
MQIKLIAADMDGTLLNSLKVLPEDYFAWIHAHPDVVMVIASGRPYYTLRKMFIPVLDRMTFLADNGAMVFRNDQLLHTDPLPVRDVYVCLESIGQIKGAIPVVSCAGCAYITPQSDAVVREIRKYYEQLTISENLTGAFEQDPVAKVAVYFPEMNAKTAGKPLISGVLPAFGAVSGPDWLDLMKPGVNKGSALRQVMQHDSVAKDKAMAFGDYLNDIEMLESCQYSYAMENAVPEVKAVARFITSSNDADGV